VLIYLYDCLPVPLKENEHEVNALVNEEKRLLNWCDRFKGVVPNQPGWGNTDGHFEAFISQKLVPKLWEGAYVVMDNCSIHKGKEIEALIQAAGQI